MRLIANDGPLGPEWRDHALRGRMSLTRPPASRRDQARAQARSRSAGRPLASGG